MKILDDIEVIQNILKGDDSLQEVLYEKYKKCVLGFILKNYGENSETEDNVSEIMIKVFINLNKFDESKSKFSTWVINLARNHMIDKWRDSRLITVNMSNYESCNNINVSCSTYDYCSDVNSPDYVLENGSSMSLISSQLTTQDYTLLDMKYIQGYNYCEIGSQFNLTSTTVSNRINYIKTKLKKDNPYFFY